MGINPLKSLGKIITGKASGGDWMSRFGVIGWLYGSAYEKQKQANELQKQAQAEQRQLIAKQEAEALETRKQLINQQREQLNIGGYNTYGTSTTGLSGVRGYIGDKLG